MLKTTFKSVTQTYHSSPDKVGPATPEWSGAPLAHSMPAEPPTAPTTQQSYHNVLYLQQNQALYAK